MKSIATGLVAALLSSLAACACSADVDPARQAASLESTLVGRLLLPDGQGNRGVEITITDGGAKAWVVFDEHGNFAHTLRGALTGLSVTAGSEPYRIDAADLPELDQAGRIDVGPIDLRDRLVEHRFVVRAAAGELDVERFGERVGEPRGEIRVGLWIGPPPVGPYGEPVSLGSRQFPAQTLGSEWAWLLSRDAHSIYFLVERPAGPGRGVDWRSGPQRLFGPFTAAEFPAELILD